MEDFQENWVANFNDMIYFHMHNHIASSWVWVHGTVIHHSW